MQLNIKKFYDTLTTDPEFNKEIRYLNKDVKLVIGDKVYLIIVREGKVLYIDDTCSEKVPASIEFRGTEDQWERLTARAPRPFYQVIETACVKHGMKMTENVETFAYLPAWNRMIYIMRDICNE